VELMRKYIALTKPGIIRGNVMTAGAGFLFASQGHIDSRRLLALLGGTSLVIACACVLNNYIDRGIDAKMERTKKRALVTHDVSGQSAIMYAVLLGFAGILLLAGYVNWLTVFIGLVAVLFYVVLYGYFKRRSEHGTLVGTVPGAASLVAGYCAVSGRLDGTALILFMIMVFWQMPHFYAIAIRRKHDYAAAGIPVLPVKRGVAATKKQMVGYIAAYVIAAASLTILGLASYTYLVVMVLIGLVWLRQSLKRSKGKQDTVWAGQLFGLSLIVLTVFSVLLATDTWLP
jgi:heme o synthase